MQRSNLLDSWDARDVQQNGDADQSDSTKHLFRIPASQMSMVYKDSCALLEFTLYGEQM